MEISGLELKAELEGGKHLVLLDVRESEELEISALPNIIHIPMDQVPDRIGELDKESSIVVICRSGGRSGKVTDYLAGQGFGRVRNLVGGMNGWAETVDPTIQKY
jgi:rhodanese-related sulfurtransferase